MYYSLVDSRKRPLNDTELSRLLSWRRSTFLVLLFGYIGYYLCRGNLPAAFPLLNKEFGFSNEQLGLIAAYSEIAYATGKLINGPLADRSKGRTIFLVGMLGAIGFNILFGLSSTLTGFILTWCGARYFLSMGWGGLAKVIGSWYPPEKNGTIMGLISINFQFGGVAAVLFAGLLVRAGVDWSGLFFYPAGALFLIFLWSMAASRNSPQDVFAGTNFGQSLNGKKQLVDFGTDARVPLRIILRKLFSVGLFWKLLLYSFLVHMLRSVFMFWTPKFLADLGMGTANAIITSAVVPLLGCAGTIFIGWYTDHYAKNGDRARVMWIMLALMTLALLGIAQATSYESKSFLIILTLLGAAGFLLLGPYSLSAGALTLDLVGAQAAGTCTGLIDGVGYLGGALASWGVGLMADHLGWSQVFMAIAACGAVTTWSAYLMSRHLQRISPS